MHHRLRLKTSTKKCFVVHYFYLLLISYFLYVKVFAPDLFLKISQACLGLYFFFISVVDFGKNVAVCFAFILLNCLNENNKAKRNITQMFLHGENIFSTNLFLFGVDFSCSFVKWIHLNVRFILFWFLFTLIFLSILMENLFKGKVCFFQSGPFISSFNWSLINSHWCPLVFLEKIKRWDRKSVV